MNSRTHRDHGFTRNERGGVLVTEEELKCAFDFFDVDHTGNITISNLRKRLGVFYRNMPAKEYRFLMNNRTEMNYDDLRSLLMNNEVTDFDPVAEAFKVYDPDGEGYVDPEILQQIFENLGFGTISEEDLSILIESGDCDGDGRISLDDFRQMIDYHKRDESET